MVVEVLSRVGQVFSRSRGGLSLAPGSMLLRLRRVSLAMLCLIGAVALGLIFFISQLGWPNALTSPLPGTSSKVGKVDNAVPLSSPSAAPAGAAAKTHQGGLAAAAVAKRVGQHRQRATHAAGNPDSGLGGSEKLASAPPTAPGSGVQPVSPEPTPATPPASESAPPASPAPTSSGTTTASTGTPSAAAVAKATVDSSHSTSVASSKSGQTAATGKDSSDSKSAGVANAKAHHDEGVAVPAPPASPGAAPSNPASAKEAADAAKASHSHH
jgi:hypothetical protein